MWILTKEPLEGQVDTSSCVAHDMGTCFLHNGYHIIRDLVAEYNLTSVIAPEGRAMFSHFAMDSLSSQSMQEFVTSSIMDGVKKKVIKVPWYAFTEKLKVLGALLTAVKKYNELHVSLFGKVEFSMPPRPSASVLEKILGGVLVLILFTFFLGAGELKCFYMIVICFVLFDRFCPTTRINMTFAKFLEENDMHALSGFLMFAHAAQGYGYVTSIPALYGLWWISPELLNGYVQMSFREQLEKLGCKKRILLWPQIAKGDHHFRCGLAFV